LLTNLSHKEFSSEKIVQIYIRRWDIETTFREDKRLLGMVKSRAKTKDAFINEIQALHIYRIIMALIAALPTTAMGMPAWEDPCAKRLVTTQLIMATWLVIELILCTPQKTMQKIDMIVKELIRDAKKKRPGRAYKRVCKGREGVFKNGRKNERA
jgi:hypothetical protein